MTINPFSSLVDLSAGLAGGQYSAVELSGLYLDRIRRANTHLHAYIGVCEAAVMQQAQASDLRRASGHALGLLDGLPIAIKDVCGIEGQLSSCGSAAWASRRSTVTSTVVNRLRAAGMVILGKTHMVEFAFGGWGTNPLQGTPHNPWDLEQHRIPGGSSSGSGVVVASGLAPAAIGSDTGGSVRIPASLVGITGLKTTQGLISLYGIAPLSATLDTIGPMTRTVADAAILTQVLAGEDVHDQITCRAPLADYRAALARTSDLSGMRVVVLAQDQFPIPLAPDVLAAFRRAVDVLRGLGATILERRFPFDFADLMRRNGQIISAEAWSLLDHIAQDETAAVGAAVRARVLAGAAVSAKDYIQALVHHRQSCEAWQDWMTDVDGLLTPTLPIAACRLDEVDEAATPLSTFTRAVNYLGACALTLPAGMSRDSLPIGVQCIAKRFDESTLIRIGCAFQQATDWHLLTPDLSSLMA
ncbi:amidase [Alcaligenaceae bacterium CGII-47]|nr:amidase [Alcaligenaceae bacterium CGII-47]